MRKRIRHQQDSNHSAGLETDWDERTLAEKLLDVISFFSLTSSSFLCLPLLILL
jgi:hypothetical protein